MTLGTNELRF